MLPIRSTPITLAPKQKVAAIIPAFNEEDNIGRVLKVLLGSGHLDEVIVVDDGSDDNTAHISKKLGARVVRLKQNGGKGNAMLQGIKATDASVIVFFDADVTGLQDEHIRLLIEPILKNKAVMCIGIRDRFFGLSNLLPAIDHLSLIGGERAVKKSLFEHIDEKYLQGFMIETSLNYYCMLEKLPVVHAYLPGLSIIVKEKKWGFYKGLRNRLTLIKEVVKIRLTLMFLKHV